MDRNQVNFFRAIQSRRHFEVKTEQIFELLFEFIEVKPFFRTTILKSMIWDVDLKAQNQFYLKAGS